MDKSHGIDIAAIAGLPQRVLDTANEMYRKLNK
jgi:DNA mismatch repair ATPase MutS